MSGPLHRYFFTLKFDGEPLVQIARQRDLIIGGHGRVRDERLHNTLAVTNDFDLPQPELADRLRAIGHRIAVDPFILTLDRISARPPSDGQQGSVALKPSRVPPQLTELQHDLRTHMRYWGVLRQAWSGTPHTTLLYWDNEPFLRPITPITAPIDSFVLIHSIVGETKHIELEKWPLKSRQMRLML